MALFSFSRDFRQEVNKGMANPENLIPNDQRTPSQRRENARKAGKASGRARREKKAMRELAQTVLNTPMRKGRIESIKTMDDLKKGEDKQLPNITAEEFALFAVMQKAMRGDVNALAFLRDTAGEKPTDHVEISTSVEEAEAEIALLIMENEQQAESRDEDGEE